MCTNATYCTLCGEGLRSVEGGWCEAAEPNCFYMPVVNASCDICVDGYYKWLNNSL